MTVLPWIENLTSRAFLIKPATPTELPLLEVSDFGSGEDAFVFDLVRLDGRADIPRPFLHRHAYYHLLCIEQGQGVHNLDFVSYELRPHSIFFIAPGQMHQWQSDIPASGYVINFSEEFYLRMFPQPHQIAELPFFQAMSEDSVLYLSKANMVEVKGLIESMAQELESHQPWRYDIIRSYLLVLLTKLRRLYQHREHEVVTARQVNLVRRFKMLVDRHYLNNWTVRSFTEALGTSERRLHEAVRLVTGQTVTQIVHGRIVLEAKRQLIQSDHNMAQIAEILKFEDPAYFSRFFKKHVNQTPSAQGPELQLVQ